MNETLRGVHRFVVGFQWMKVVVWTAFAAGGPLCFLLMRNYLGVTALGAISAVLGLVVFGPETTTFRFRAGLRMFLVVQGVAFAGYGGYVLAKPSAPWVHGAAGTRTGLALHPETRALHAVEFTESNGAFIVRTADGYVEESFPGHLALALGVARDGTVLVHEDRTDALHVRAKDGTFTLRFAPGPYDAYAPMGDDLFIAAGTTLVRATPPFEAEAPVPGVGAISTVCSAGTRVFALRTRTDMAPGEAWESEDAGATFHTRPNTSLPATRCGLSEDGYTWVTSEGLFEGDVAVARGQGAFERRIAPAPRIEALAVNPRRGSEALVGVWGAGVYRTEDAGRTWTHIGLEGYEVSALVVDFEQRRAYAGTGSGIYERTF